MNHTTKPTIKKKLDYKKMIEDIEVMVETDFCCDMDSRTLPDSTPYTQEDALRMAKIIGSIYSIAHCNSCTACQGKYFINSIKKSMKTTKQLREKLGHDIKDHCRGYHNLSCSELSVLLDSVREEYKGMIDKLELEIKTLKHEKDTVERKIWSR